MELKELLQSVPDHESMTDQQVADALNATNYEQDTTDWTADKIMHRLGPDDANKVIGDMSAAGNTAPVFKAAFIAFSVSGLELASQSRQSMIDVLAAISQWSPEFTNRVKSLGRIETSLWKQAGMSGTATAEQVASARIQIERDEIKKQWKQSANDRRNAYYDAVDAYDFNGPEPVL